MKFLFSLIIICLYSFHAMAQQAIPKDTSYNLNSAYIKELKKFPFIKPASLERHENIKIKRNIVYHSIENRTLLIDLFQPQHSDSSNPIVLLIHGGGWSSGSKEMLEPLAQVITQAGYLCATVEYRLSPEAKYPAAISDLKQAIKWIRQNGSQYGGNPNKIAVLGSSSGAQLATLLGATHLKPFYTDEDETNQRLFELQAIVNLDGVLAFIHPLSMEGTDKPGKPSAATRWFGNPYPENQARWIEASPLTHANKQTPPTLFINSQYDRFHAGRDEYIQILNQAGIYTEVHTLPETPHTFWLFNPWFSPTSKWIIDFLDFTLKNKKKCSDLNK